MTLTRFLLVIVFLVSMLCVNTGVEATKGGSGSNEGNQGSQGKPNPADVTNTGVHKDKTINGGTVVGGPGG